MIPSNTRILIVDDMSTMRKMVRHNLAGMKLENITEAADGQEAWEKLTRAYEDAKPFELVLSDWNMPRMDGLELLKLVRRSAAIYNLPFILITAENQKEQVLQAIELKVTNWIAKPYTDQQFRERLLAGWTKSAA